MKKSTFFSVVVLLATTFMVSVTISSCSGEDPSPTPTPTPTPTPNPTPNPTPTFSGPTYLDNYTSIASWSSNSQWNLANVHDPTVEKCGDYYYMYQTDASYGNAHVDHGHFPGGVVLTPAFDPKTLLNGNIWDRP